MILNLVMYFYELPFETQVISLQISLILVILFEIISFIYIKRTFDKYESVL